MSDQNEVSVKLTADIKSYLQGMKDSQEHTEKAVSGMKGDLGSAIESFEKFGGTALAIGAVGVAFEALRESVDFVKEAIEETNDLSKSFKDLAYQTGISHQELNALATAQALEGGSIKELEGWMKGATKAIKANADMLVENGIAASKAELMAMPFTDYLKKVMAAAESITDPMRRGIFLQEALGRAGMEAAPQIREMLEQLDGAPEVLARYGRAIGGDNIAQMERAEHATGKLDIATRGLKQTLAEVFGDSLSQATTEMAGFVAELNKAVPFLEAQARMTQLLVSASPVGIAKHMITGGWDSSAESAKGGPDWGEGAEVKNPEKKIKTKEEDADEKKAAELRVALRKAADAAIIQSADFVLQEQMKNDKELVASGAMTFAELEADMRMNYKQRFDQVMAALKDEEKANAAKPIDLRATLEKEKQAEQKYSSDILDIGRQAAENGRKEKEKAAAESERARKQGLDLAKLVAQDELDLQRAMLEKKEQALDQSLSFGRINEAQWVAMKKAGIAQELKAKLDALATEQNAAKDDLIAWTKIENQKSALRRKADADFGKLETEAVNKSKARWDSFFGSMTGGFDSAIQGLLKGTMTWGDAFKSVTEQALSGLISFFVRWGEEEALKWATSLAMGATGRAAEATGAAAVYAVNAMGSVAAIPFWGWSAAPAVGATAYAEGLGFAGLASAAGGWDRVPADQIAQIHKNEMILPEWAAEGARRTFSQASEGGGQGARPIHINIQALDGQDVHRVLSRNQDSLFRIINEGARNRRLR